jgi:hypothetical protein
VPLGATPKKAMASSTFCVQGVHFVRPKLHTSRNSKQTIPMNLNFYERRSRMTGVNFETLMSFVVLIFISCIY